MLNLQTLQNPSPILTNKSPFKRIPSHAHSLLQSTKVQCPPISSSITSAHRIPSSTIEPHSHGVSSGQWWLQQEIARFVCFLRDWSAYWGLQELDEEVRVGYLITVWHSQEDYLEYKNSNVFNLTMRLLEKAAVGKIIHHLFRGVKELTMPTFQAKLTEFVLASAKNGVSNNTLKKTVGKVWAVLDAHGHPSSIGECVNGDDVYVIVIGWPAYEQTMENEAFMTPINELSSLADLRFWHVPFDKYTSRL